MVKDIQPFKMRKSLNQHEKVYVKSFSGASVEDMKDYVKPSLKFKPDVIVLHAGTNSLSKVDSPEIIAEKIINLALDIKNDDNEVAVSSILPRFDNWDEKGAKVNYFLKLKTAQCNLGFIDHSNIKSRTHFKPKGIHLNTNGSILLSNNIIKFINL